MDSVELGRRVSSALYCENDEKWGAWIDSSIFKLSSSFSDYAERRGDTWYEPILPRQRIA